MAAMARRCGMTGHETALAHRKGEWRCYGARREGGKEVSRRNRTTTTDRRVVCGVGRTRLYPLSKRVSATENSTPPTYVPRQLAAQWQTSKLMAAGVSGNCHILRPQTVSRTAHPTDGLRQCACARCGKLVGLYRLAFPARRLCLCAQAQPRYGCHCSVVCPAVSCRVNEMSTRWGTALL
jgi:hypothetical protein